MEHHVHLLFWRIWGIQSPIKYGSWPYNSHPSASVSHSGVSDYLQPYGLLPARIFCPWDSPGKNTGVGCHSLSPGNLSNQGIEPGSPALQADSLPSEPPGNKFFKKFLLTCSWFTILISAVQQSDSVILFQILFHYGLLQDIEYSSLCHSRALLFIHSICNSLHLPVPNSQSFPPPLPPMPWQTQVCSL